MSKSNKALFTSNPLVGMQLGVCVSLCACVWVCDCVCVCVTVCVCVCVHDNSVCARAHATTLCVCVHACVAVCICACTFVSPCACLTSVCDRVSACMCVCTMCVCASSASLYLLRVQLSLQWNPSTATTPYANRSQAGCSPGHMEELPASCLIALHAGPCVVLRQVLLLLLTNVAHLRKTMLSTSATASHQSNSSSIHTAEQTVINCSMKWTLTTILHNHTFISWWM